MCEVSYYAIYRREGFCAYRDGGEKKRGVKKFEFCGIDPCKGAVVVGVTRVGEVRSSRLVHTQQIASSNLAPATCARIAQREERQGEVLDAVVRVLFLALYGSSVIGSASDFDSEGCRFEPYLLCFSW